MTNSARTGGDRLRLFAAVASAALALTLGSAPKDASAASLFSIDTYTGNGSTTAYSVTFPYLSKSDVQVTINGAATTAYTWTSSNTISFTTAPAAGAQIVIQRQTYVTSPERTFAGGPLASSDLNSNALQSVYLAQELLDGQATISGTIASGQAGLTTAHVANNAAFSLLATAPLGLVIRNGYATAGDAPPLLFVASSSPCSLNGGSGDGGSQVRSLDGKCWLANFPSEGVDVRQFGAKCDGSTNDSTPIQSAINYLSIASVGSGRVIIPATQNGCVASLTVNAANNITLAGVSNTIVAAGGSKLIAPNLTSTVVTVGNVGGFGMENLQLKGPATAASQITASEPPLLYLNQPVDAVFRNVSVNNGYDLVKFNNVSLAHWYGGNLRNFTHTALTITGNAASNTAGGGNDYYFYSPIIDEDSAAYQNQGSLAAGVYVDQNGGSITFDGGDILHGHVGLWLNPGVGQFVNWLYATNLYVDTCDYTGTTVSGATTTGNGNTYVTGSAGIKVTPNGGGKVQGIMLANGWSSTCLNGVYLAGDSSSTLSGVNLSNWQSLNDGGAVAYLKYATDVNISNPLFAGGSQLSSGTYAGLEIDTGSNNITLTGGRIGSPVEGYGATMKFGLQFDSGFTGTFSGAGTNLAGNSASAVFFPTPSTSSGITLVNMPPYSYAGPIARSIAYNAGGTTYTAGPSPETLYLQSISGGTFTSVSLPGFSTSPVCTSLPCAVRLNPNQTLNFSVSGGTVSAVSNRE